MSDLTIKLDRVSLKRGETEVFKNLSWEVRKGEHWFVMGNNGSGKTSLIDLIMGHLWPQKGKVVVLGETLGEVFLPQLRKRIGYVSPWIFNRMGSSVPVYNVVASGTDGSVGFWGNVPDPIYQQALAKLEFFHCADLAERAFGSLSSGQQFKVILARALINDPELFLLDEPFAQLDIGARMQAYDLIEKWAGLGHSPSIILVTHHLEDLTASYTKGLLIKDSRAVFKGSRNDLLTNAFFKKTFGITKKIF